MPDPGSCFALRPSPPPGRHTRGRELRVREHQGRRRKHAHIHTGKMGGSDSKLNFRKAVIQLTTKTQVGVFYIMVFIIKGSA